MGVYQEGCKSCLTLSCTVMVHLPCLARPGQVGHDPGLQGPNPYMILRTAKEEQLSHFFPSQCLAGSLATNRCFMKVC